MQPPYYLSVTEASIKIDSKPDKNTVFFSDDFDLVLDWAFGPEPYAKDQECDGQCDNCICYCST